MPTAMSQSVAKQPQSNQAAASLDRSARRNTMKLNWEDMPYGPIWAAMKTTLGRCVLVALTCSIGFGCGSMLAGGLTGSFFEGMIEFPIGIYASIMFSQGLWVWPLVALMSGLFMRLQLPMWTLILPFAASVWLSYEVTQHMNADPPLSVILESHSR
jgi:hypothetical protein